MEVCLQIEDPHTAELLQQVDEETLRLVVEQIETNKNHIQAVEEGVRAADAGEFASKAEIERVFSKYS